MFVLRVYAPLHGRTSARGTMAHGAGNGSRPELARHRLPTPGRRGRPAPHQCTPPGKALVAKGLLCQVLVSLLTRRLITLDD